MSTSTSPWRRSVVVAVVALVAAILPAAPAGAVTEACPSSIPKAAFADLAGMSPEAIEAINCVAYYGIAQGTSKTTFLPNGEVPRWQMALFLARTATHLGMALPSGSPQGFTDIGGLSAEAQTAVNQLAQLGIARGTAPGRFSPQEPVSRWQMALFLTRLHARVGSLPNGAPQGFTDIGGLTAEIQTAINQLVQLGIARGTSKTTFGPEARVLRYQMALFLARHLEAGRASPHRVSLTLSTPAAPTSDTVTATVTVLDVRGVPLAGRPVDVFTGSIAADGTCLLDPNAKIGGGDAGTGSNCKIDSNDPKTNAQGQVVVKITHTTVVTAGWVVAWIGEPNEVFDRDTVRTMAAAELRWVPPPTALVVDDVVAKYGTQARVMARFVDAGGAAVAAAGQKVVFTVSRAGSQIIKQTVLSDSTGVATLAYVGPPDPGPGDSPVTVDTVKAFWDKDGDGVDDGAAELDDTATVTWDDDEPVSTSATLVQAAVSHLGTQQNTLTVTVTNKFGTPIGGAGVTFTVVGASSVSQTVTTNGAGVATVTYAGPGGQGIDTIDASVDLNRDGDTADPGDLASIGPILHYWVEAAPELPGMTVFDILAVDTAKDTIDVVEVGGGGSQWRLRYDSTNDAFSVDGQARSLAQFEAALSSLVLPALDGPGKVELATNPYTTTSSQASVFVLKTK